jgi:NAD:arginine ADP-ribosyltransferase/Folate receptor family
MSTSSEWGTHTSSDDEPVEVPPSFPKSTPRKKGEAAAVAKATRRKPSSRAKPGREKPEKVDKTANTAETRGKAAKDKSLQKNEPVLLARVTDLKEEDGRTKNPLGARFNARDRTPLPSFETALEPVLLAHPDIEQCLKICKSHAMDLQDDLPQLNFDQIAVLVLYTMESYPPESSFYVQVNGALRNADRSAVSPFEDIVFLLLSALRELPPSSCHTVVRGVKLSSEDLSVRIKEGREFQWSGFSSTSKSVSTMKTFLGKDDARTLFMLSLTQGDAREIDQFSLYPSETEVLLPPNSRFRVDGVLDQGDLTIINCSQVESLDPLMDLRTDVNGDVASSGETSDSTDTASHSGISDLEAADAPSSNDDSKSSSGVNAWILGHLPTVFALVCCIAVVATGIALWVPRKVITSASLETVYRLETSATRVDLGVAVAAIVDNPNFAFVDVEVEKWTVKHNGVKLGTMDGNFSVVSERSKKEFPTSSGITVTDAATCQAIHAQTTPTFVFETLIRTTYGSTVWEDEVSLTEGIQRTLTSSSSSASSPEKGEKVVTCNDGNATQSVGGTRLIGICYKYARNNCCPTSSAQEIRNASARCSAESTCAGLIEDLVCGVACDPKQKAFTDGSSVTVCKIFADEFYDACKGSSVDLARFNPSGVNCVAVSTFSDGTDLFEAMGFEVDDTKSIIDNEPITSSCFSRGLRRADVSPVLVLLGAILLSAATWK